MPAKTSTGTDFPGKYQSFFPEIITSTGAKISCNFCPSVLVIFQAPIYDRPVGSLKTVSVRRCDGQVDFLFFGGWGGLFVYNGLRGGCKPRKHLFLTTFADIQEGMATQQTSLDSISQTPPKYLH